LSVTGFGDDGKPVTISPGNGAKVASNSSFHLKFDRFLLPESAIRQAICVQPQEAMTPENCTTPVSFGVAYDPATREVIFRQTDSMPLLGTHYVMTVFQPSATDPASLGFRAFDGAILHEQTTIEIEVSGNAAAPGFDDAPTSATWCEMDGAESVLLNNCGVSGCHIDTRDTQGNLLGAPMDLQFSVYKPGALFLDPFIDEVIQRTAINHVAHETQIGEHAAHPQEAPDRFGRAMSIVDAKSAGNSYLLYKLLIGEDTSTHQPFIADDAERQRLRNAFVVANPMPLPNGATVPVPVQMNQGYINELSRWIQSGAETPDCGN
jgi:hypothetical protein